MTQTNAEKSQIVLMRLAKTCAIVIFLQGISPIVAFGIANRFWLILIPVAIVYSLLAWALWRGNRWAIVTALILTLPQLVIICSNYFSWECFVGIGFGMGFAPGKSFVDFRIISYWSYGTGVYFSIFAKHPFIESRFSQEPYDWFVVPNLFAIFVAMLLVIALAVPTVIRWQRKKTETVN